MNLTQRFFWLFHTTMGCVDLGVIGLELAGWYAARDTIFLSGLALCGFGFLAYARLLFAGGRRVVRHESPGATRGPSEEGLATNHPVGTSGLPERRCM
jgi:hypothetical protein